MVCQWVPGIGYCYMDRRNNKADFDGMQGDEATPIEAFGLAWTDKSDGTVDFYPSGRPVTATYYDGRPRRWQSRKTEFEHVQLKSGVIRQAKELPR